MPSVVNQSLLFGAWDWQGWTLCTTLEEQPQQFVTDSQSRSSLTLTTFH
jgi:hypothetical protein